MSDLTSSSNPLINHLVKKAIEKKKTQQQTLINQEKPPLEYALFSQFDVIKALASRNGKTTLYHLAKLDEPTSQVCCKVLNTNTNKMARDSLVNEASLLELSQHSHVAKFIRSGEELGQPYFMYQWVTGESMAEKLARYPTKGFRPDHIAGFIYQLADTLNTIHERGICHLDIKPSNIILGDDDSITLIDFGAARYIDKQQAHAEVSLQYASPLYLASGKAKPEDDVYSLALLTGHLFLGGVFGNAWRSQLLKRPRPLLIPVSVWRLIKRVIQRPRSHQYTAISFAHELAAIEIETINIKYKATIFADFNYHDFLPAIPVSVPEHSFTSFKYLCGSGLVCGILLLASGYFFSPSPEETPMPVVSEQLISPTLQQTLPELQQTLIEPQQTTVFLGLSPWEQRRMMENISDDAEQLALYQQTQHNQKIIQATQYQQQQQPLALQHDATKNLLVRLSDIRINIVKLKEQLQSENALTLATERSLTAMMANINDSLSAYQTVTQYLRSNEDELAKLIVSGNTSAVERYLEAAWENHQGNAYFYSRAITDKIIASVILSAKKNAQQNRHSMAIKNIEAAALSLGNSPLLTQTIHDLSISRSEYILFSTVTEKSIFSPEKLDLALRDLAKYSPLKFAEVTELLTKMTTETIQQSHKKNQPAKGALAVQSALADFKHPTGS